MKLKNIILIVFLTGIFFNLTRANDDLIENIFKEIESGISSGNVSRFSSYLNNQTYLSLKGSSGSYYSSNQAFYVISDFLNINRPVSFKFSVVKTKGSTPYATGTLTFENKGRRETALVYVSLIQSGNSWKISQITIS